MKLSSHEEYGLRCLLQVARQGVGGSTTIPEISRNEGISEPYAAKLLRVLRQSGFVKAARGKAGGYTLASPAENICVGDALSALGGRLYDESFCRRHVGIETNCAHSAQCAIRTLWRSLQNAIDELLQTTSVRDLLEINGSPALLPLLPEGHLTHGIAGHRGRLASLETSSLP